MKKLRSASQYNVLEISSSLDLGSETDRVPGSSQTFRDRSQDGGNSSHQSLSTSDWSVEAYADGLMDELFDEVDHILDGGADIDDPDFSEYVSLQTITVPSSVLSPSSYGTLPHSGLAVRRRERSAAPSLEAIDTKSQPRQTLFLDKLLLILAGLSTLMAAIVMLVIQGKLLPTWVANSGQSQTSVSTATTQDPQTVANEQADQQFAGYIQRSLDVIQQQGTKANPAPGLVGVPILPGNPNLPTVAINGNIPQIPGRFPTYVPIYSSPQGAVPAIPGVPTIPSVPKPATGTLPTTSQPRSWVTIPSTSIAPSVPQVTIPTPAVTYTLVGLLQLGSRSAALFDINGNTQRISIGEPIGSSGWILVKIASQEALVRRNGEVRSIYVGQKF